MLVINGSFMLGLNWNSRVWGASLQENEGALAEDMQHQCGHSIDGGGWRVFPKRFMLKKPLQVIFRVHVWLPSWYTCYELEVELEDFSFAILHPLQKPSMIYYIHTSFTDLELRWLEHSLFLWIKNHVHGNSTQTLIWFKCEQPLFCQVRFK